MTEELTSTDLEKYNAVPNLYPLYVEDGTQQLGKDRGQWWLELIQDPAKLQQIADYLCVKLVQTDNDDIGLEDIWAVIDQFMKVREATRKLNGMDEPEESVGLGKMSLADQYDIRAALGYYAIHIGLKLENLCKLLAYNPEELSAKDLLLAGAGPGTFFEHVLTDIEQRTGATHAIDIAPKMVELLQSKFPLVKSKISDMATFDGIGEVNNYDVIVWEFSIDLVSDPVRCIMNLFKLLKSGGKLMITFLSPLNQSGYTENPDNTVPIGGQQRGELDKNPLNNLGNTGNPILDIQRLISVLKTVLKEFLIKNHYNDTVIDQALNKQLKFSAGRYFGYDVVDALGQLTVYPAFYLVIEKP